MKMIKPIHEPRRYEYNYKGKIYSFNKIEFKKEDEEAFNDYREGGYTAIRISLLTSFIISLLAIFNIFYSSFIVFIFSMSMATVFYSSAIIIRNKIQVSEDVISLAQLQTTEEHLVATKRKGNINLK